MASFNVFALFSLCLHGLIVTHVHSQCELSCENTDDDIQDVIEQMADLGYGVATGHFELYDHENAVASDIYIPFAQPNTDYLVSHFDDGNTYTRIGGQDGIVFRGCTPPTARYFGYRSYSAIRVKAQNESNIPTATTTLQASLGDTTNHLVINTDSNDNSVFPAPFDRKTNIVSTGDEQTWTDLVTAFTNADLLTSMSINLDAINNGVLAKYTNLGWFRYSESELETPRDTVSIVYRIEFDENSECNKELYLNQSFPFYIFYRNEVQPRYPINRDLRRTIDKKQKCENTRQNRYYFDQAVDSIRKYVEQEHDYKFVGSTKMNDQEGRCSWFGGWWPPNKDEYVHIFKHGFYCLLYQKDCMFDNRDTYYSWDRTDHVLSDTDLFVIVGLNHNNFSLSTMNSISLSAVTNAENGNAFEIVDSISNDDYESYDIGKIIECGKKKKKSHSSSSSSSFHRFETDSGHEVMLNDKKHDCKELRNVFAVQVARPENCATLPFPAMCPDAETLSADQSFILFGEATLNPKTKTMPDQDCLIEWRVLRFTQQQQQQQQINDANYGM